MYLFLCLACSYVYLSLLETIVSLPPCASFSLALHGFVRLFICLLVRSFVMNSLFACLLVYLFACSFVCWLVWLLVRTRYSLACLFASLLPCLLACLLILIYHLFACLLCLSVYQTWCPTCASRAVCERKRLTATDMHQTARQFGGEFLSLEYLGAAVKVRRKCSRSVCFFGKRERERERGRERCRRGTRAWTLYPGNVYRG